MALIGVGGYVRTAVCAPVQQFDFNIASGELRAALEQFASFTDTQIVSDASLTGTTRGVHGRYTKEEALMVLLGGTGLLCERFPGRPEFSVHPAHHQRPGRRCLVSLQSSPSDPVPPAPEPKIDPVEIQVYGKRKLGTNLHDVTPIGSSLTSWDQEQIRILGARVTPDLLESTQNFEGGPTQDTRYGSTEAAANSGLGWGANLRGLGSRSTLVLFNGHPVAPSGNDASFADLLQFPLSATTMVSMMPDGASGIYGTQAVGGVINIDTLDHYTRPESHLEFGTVTDGHQEKYRLSQEIGTHWDGGSALAVVELMQWDALPSFERWQANTAQVPYTNPGNLVTSLGTYPVPSGQSGQSLDFSTLALGSPRLANPNLGADILPSQKRWAFYGSFDQKLTPSITLWSYVLETERYGRESRGGQEVYLNVAQSPFLSSRPPGPIDEEYNLLKEFGLQIASVNVRTRNAAVELHVKLPRDWHLVFSGSESLETETQVTTGQVDPTALQDAVSNPQKTDAFNPLGDGSNTDASVLARLDVPKWFGSRSQLRSYEAVADGPILSLGTGPLLGAMGFEARDQRFDWAFSQPVTGNDLRRQLYAAFTELKAPLLDADTLAAPFRNFALSLAGRIEHYSDFGRSATPRIGFSWVPITHVELRGAFARSIRAPDMGDLSQRTNSSFGQMLSGTSALLWSGGSPKLTVERALTRTAGLKIDSGPSLPHFTFDLSYFDILSKDRIEQVPFDQNILTDPLYSSFIIRKPDPDLQQYVCNNSTFIGGARESCLKLPVDAIVDLRLHNAGTLWTNGIDTKAGVSIDSTLGSWGLDVAGTYVLHYRQANLPAAALVSALNTESQPLALHLLGTASWKLGDFRANVAVRYANGYHNNETQPITYVDSWTTTDLRVAYTFGREDSPTAHPMEVAVFVTNIFDKYPPFSNDVIANVGYDEENGDLSGRQVTLSVHVKW